VAWTWADLPVGRAVRLTGASPAALALMLDPIPDGAPAIVTFRPSSVPSMAGVVVEALDALEAAALDLYPAWLPGAEHIASPAGAGVAAVRALARNMADGSGHFLADLAERALRGQPPAASGHRAEARTAGLARVLAATYRRSSAALVVEVPAGFSTAQQETLIGAAEWLAGHGPMGVWLVGEPLLDDRLMTFAVRLPEAVERLERETPPASEELDLPVLSVPPVAGTPNRVSSIEMALEMALQQHPWARGRVWHQRYQPTPLDLLRYLDVLWPAEKVVVEVDGEEHRLPLKWADDRLRDNMLQRDGYKTLRYPNARIASDLAAVLADIRAHLLQRRTPAPEGLEHAQR
jgi:very-short-patch-repair endonuclease